MAMSEEQKAAMAAGRKRAAAQRAAEKETGELEEANAVTTAEAFAKAESGGHTTRTEPNIEAVEYGGQQEWGPYGQYEEVHTPYGLYGLPKGQVMHFEERKIWSKSEQREVLTMKPIRRSLVRK